MSHITTCSLLNVNRRFEGTCLLHLEIRKIGKVKQVASSYLLRAGFFFEPEDGRELFLRKVVCYSTDYKALYPRRKHSSNWSKFPIAATFVTFLTGLLFNPQDGSSKFIRNVSELLSDYTTSHAIKQHTSQGVQCLILYRHYLRKKDWNLNFSLWWTLTVWSFELEHRAVWCFGRKYCFYLQGMYQNVNI
jgi:hypothetical protein